MKAENEGFGLMCSHVSTDRRGVERAGDVVFGE